MAKVDINGEIREMTPEEQASFMGEKVCDEDD